MRGSVAARTRGRPPPRATRSALVCSTTMLFLLGGLLASAPVCAATATSTAGSVAQSCIRVDLSASPRSSEGSGLPGTHASGSEWCSAEGAAKGWSRIGDRDHRGPRSRALRHSHRRRWRGKVAVSVPLSGTRDAVLHRVGGIWVAEGRHRGQRTVWVSQLSWFSTLSSKAAKALCLTRDRKKFVKCLVAKGVKYIDGQLSKWIADQLGDECIGAIVAKAGKGVFASATMLLSLFLDPACVGQAVDGPPPPPAPPPPPPPAPPPPPPPGPPPPPPYYSYAVNGTCVDGACGLKIRNGPGYTSYQQIGVLNDGDGCGSCVKRAVSASDPVREREAARQCGIDFRAAAGFRTCLRPPPRWISSVRRSPSADNGRSACARVRLASRRPARRPAVRSRTRSRVVRRCVPARPTTSDNSRRSTLVH